MSYKDLRNNVNPKWIHDHGLRRLNIAVTFMFASAAANGYDGSLINGLQAIPRFSDNLGKISSSYLGLIVGGISLGGLACFIPASYLTDWQGRRLSVALGSSLMLAAAIIQAFTSGPRAFLITRVMIGVGLAFAQTAAPPLTTEVAHPKHRGQITAMFQATWLWGSIISACVTLATLHLDNSWAWRVPCLLQGFFPALQLLGLLLVPESPRWLISKGRKSEALDILSKFHANGERRDELVQFEFGEICTAIEQERQAAATASSGWLSFLQSRGNRHRLLICLLVGFMIQWAGNGIVSYYLAPILKSVGVTSPVTQSAINLGLQVWNAIFAAAGALGIERCGRRVLWLTSACGMLASFIVITALSGVFAERGSTAAGNATVAFLFIYFAFYVIAFTPLSLAYPVEILPFNLRAKGLALSQTVAFTAGFFNQYVNPIALEALAWKFYFVYIGTLAAMIPIIYFLFPETKGHTLEEIAFVFDGEPCGAGVSYPEGVRSNLDPSSGQAFEKKLSTAHLETVAV